MSANTIVIVRVEVKSMDNKQKQKEAQKSRVHEKERTSIHWELTNDDKAFLGSCNISSE